MAKNFMFAVDLHRYSYLPAKFWNIRESILGDEAHRKVNSMRIEKAIKDNLDTVLTFSYHVMRAKQYL